MKPKFSSIVSFLALVIAGAFYSSCIKPPQYSVTPHIDFKSFSKNVVKENTDSLLLVFSFTDGDGDLGPINTSDTTLDIFLTDSRDNSIKRYQMPNITPEGNIKAISGDVTIAISPFATRAGHTTDQLSYTIQIRDRSGHLSNTTQTSQITINR